MKFGQPGDLGTPERWILVEGPIIMSKTCTDPDLHELYPGNCPSCNPEGYRALLAQAPQGIPSAPEREARPTRRTEPLGTHDAGYSDSY